MTLINPFANKPEAPKEPVVADEVVQEPDTAATQETPPRGIPTQARRSVREELSTVDSTYNQFFEDEDSEADALANVKAKGLEDELQSYSGHEDPVITKLKSNYEELLKRYPRGGSRLYRFLTADVLMAAPEDWFDRFQTNVKEGTAWVQSEISERGRATDISDAQADPTDEVLQDSSFMLAHSVAMEWLNRHSYRGIEKFLVATLIANEIVGFSVIDPLWRDRSLDEIVINGPKDIQVEVAGKMRRVPAVNFRDERHAMVLLERIFSPLGKNLARNSPLVKGRFYDKSRIFAVDPSIAPGGPNVNIRRHPARYITPVDFVAGGTMSEELGVFLGNLINKGCSYAVIGGTSSGKTTALNAFTGFVDDKERIVTLENNLEMIPNPRKQLARAMETRQASVEGNFEGTSMRKLVEAATQMRPEVIMVGEVTDGSAYDLVQALNIGHYGASTIHANSEREGIARIASLVSVDGLITNEGALSLISSAFDILIFVQKHRDGTRRIASVSEVSTFISSNSAGQPTLEVTPLWRFKQDGVDENRKSFGHWEQLNELSEERTARRNLDMTEALTWSELAELSRVPDEYNEFLKQAEKRKAYFGDY